MGPNDPGQTMKNGQLAMVRLEKENFFEGACILGEPKDDKASLPETDPVKQQQDAANKQSTGPAGPVSPQKETVKQQQEDAANKKATGPAGPVSPQKETV